MLNSNYTVCNFAHTVFAKLLLTDPLKIFCEEACPNPLDMQLCATPGLRRTFIYKQTWQHPKSKQWNCIDYVVMRQGNGGLRLAVFFGNSHLSTMTKRHIYGVCIFSILFNSGEH